MLIKKANANSNEQDKKKATNKNFCRNPDCYRWNKFPISNEMYILTECNSRCSSQNMYSNI